MVHTLNLGIQEAEAWGFLWVPGQPGLQVPGHLELHRETVSKQNRNLSQLVYYCWLTSDFHWFLLIFPLHVPGFNPRYNIPFSSHISSASLTSSGSLIAFLFLTISIILKTNVLENALYVLTRLISVKQCNCIVDTNFTCPFKLSIITMLLILFYFLPYKEKLPKIMLKMVTP